MPPSTTSPTLFITTTSQEQTLMKQGFIDRMIYKLVFKPVQINTFHKTSQYIVKKFLCEPYIHLDLNNAMYINHQVANEGVREIIKKMAINISTKGKEDYIQNNRLMKMLRVAIRDSRNLNRASKYQSGDQMNQQKKTNFWYIQ